MNQQKLAIARVTKGIRRQVGVGMVEVMMAVFVLALGGLGFAALQVRALQTTNGSHFRSQAMEIAQDLSERFHVNQSEVTIYENSWSGAAPTSAPTTCRTAACTPAALAAFDVASIKYAANTLLPQGVAKMERCAGSSLLLCIYVGWSGNQVSDSDCYDSASGGYVDGIPNCIILEGAAR